MPNFKEEMKTRGWSYLAATLVGALLGPEAGEAVALLLSFI